MLSAAGDYLTAREVARSLDASERTVYRKLTVLAREVIVETDGTTRARVYLLRERLTDSLLDRVAKAFRTSGAGERQRKQHARDRDRHWRALAYWHERQQQAV